MIDISTRYQFLIQNTLTGTIVTASDSSTGTNALLLSARGNPEMGPFRETLSELSLKATASRLYLTAVAFILPFDWNWQPCRLAWNQDEFDESALGSIMLILTHGVLKAFGETYKFVYILWMSWYQDGACSCNPSYQWKAMTSLSVREITKSSSTFSATDINSNIVWLLQLHDTIQTKSHFWYQI